MIDLRNIEDVATQAGGLMTAVTHELVRKPAGGGGGHTPGVGWMCTGCAWKFSYDVPEDQALKVWRDDQRHSGGTSIESAEHACDGHDRDGMAGVLIAHYPRANSYRGVHCECGEIFCCSVAMANHQADEIRKTGTWEL